MSSSTHAISIVADKWTAVSNGNLNVVVQIASDARIRGHVGGTEPELDTADYFYVNGPPPGTAHPAFMVTDLEAEDELWLKADGDPQDIIVVRGNVRITR